MGLFRREKRQVYSIGSTDPAFIRLMGGYGPTLSGVSVSEDSALRLMAVWRAVNLTSGTVAAMPLKVYRDRGGRRTEISEPLFEDPMYPELTWYEGIEMLVGSLLLYGNAYALKIYNEAGTRVVRLLPLDPSTVTLGRVDPLDTNPAGKIFRISGSDNVFTPNEIMHVMGLSTDGLCGLSPISYARETIGAGIAAEQVAAKMFDSGLLTGGILQAETDMSDAQAEEAKRLWREKTSGTVRSYEVALLSAGWKFTPTQIPPVDAQWLESRHFSVAEIARLYGMPPALLFEYMDTGNVEADKLGAQWLRFGLNATLRRLESRLSLHLLPRGTFCEFVREGLLQGTPAEQIDMLVAQVEAKLLTVNEAREIMNRSPLPEDEINPPAPAQAESEDEDGSGDQGISDSANDDQQESGE